MVTTKAKRSVLKKQSTQINQKSQAINHNLVRFPQATDKVVKDVEFSADSDYHSITISFQDKTCLNFCIDAGFTLKTDYSDWKTGIQRIIRRWPMIRSN